MGFKEVRFYDLERTATWHTNTWHASLIADFETKKIMEIKEKMS